MEVGKAPSKGEQSWRYTSTPSYTRTTGASRLLTLQTNSG